MALDVHPEEALDRALKGELSAAEQRELDQHLLACRACKAHLALARSGREACTPRPWGDRLNRLAVDHALENFGRWRWPAFVSFRSGRRWALATAGLVLALGGMASAGLWHRQVPAPEPVLTLGTKARPAARATATPRPLLALSDSPPVQAEIIDDSPIPHRATRVQPSAANLFERAATLRNRNRTDEAIAVFRKLQQLYPQTRESRISFAVAGRMLLDRGRPAQALAQFDQHLAHGGEAAQEAMAGRATALGQLGRLSAERETWQRLLDSYPGTVYASQAKQRLARPYRGQEAFSGIEHSR